MLLIVLLFQGIHNNNYCNILVTVSYRLYDRTKSFTSIHVSAIIIKAPHIITIHDGNIAHRAAIKPSVAN